jgi:predicted permease
MRWIYKIPLRVRSLFRKRRVERELDEEMRFHLEKLIEENVAGGMTPEEARYAALREFGGVEQLKEECRDAWHVRFITELGQDLRYGLRQLRRNPGFTVVAILTLALGIGANTAVFSLIDAVMIRTLPVRNPHQLLLVGWHSERTPHAITQSGHGGEVSYPVFERFSALKNVFSSVFGFASSGTLNVTINHQASLAKAEMVTGTYFSGLGIQTILGRGITPEDESAGAPHVAVLSYRYWDRRFGRSRRVLGKTLTLNRVPFTIIGVAPPEFMGVQRGYTPDLWVPIGEPAVIMPWGIRASDRSPRTAENWWWMGVMARLRPGVSVAQARARLETVLGQSFTAILNRPPTARETPHAEITSASRGWNGLKQKFQDPLWTLMAVVGLVLLIACANIAGLLLARAAGRRREVAMRLAVGASRVRLVRQLLTESVMLAAIGAAGGGIFAWWGTRALLFLVSSGRQPLAINVRPDLTILAFTAIAAVVAGLIFGIVPALYATRGELVPALKESSGAASPAAPRQRLSLGKALVVAQVALGLVLLVGAGLLVRTLQNLKGQNLGFDQHQVLLFGIDPTEDGYKGARLMDFYRQLSERIHTLPGVRSSSLSFLTLIADYFNAADFSIDGYTPQPGQKMNVYWNTVGPDFFKTMGIPVILGRGIEEGDTGSASKVIVINQSMVRKYFNGENPVGRRLRFPRFPTPKVEYEIVGVVGDAKYWSLRHEIAPTAYFPYRQMAWMFNFTGAMHYEVRTAAAPSTMVPAVQRAVRNLDSSLPLFDVKTQVEQIDESLMQERLLANGAGFFSMLALLLACIGLYGLLAYTVGRRTREIGVRMALGARRRQVVWMVMRESLMLIGIGIALGLPLAFALTRFLASMLYGVKPTDPLTFVVVSLILIAVALAACYIPARRAAKVDPMVALRYE